MAESKDKQQSVKAARQKLSSEFQNLAPDATLSQMSTKLGIPKQEMTENVSVAVSVLLERIEDLTRELNNSRREFTELEQLVDVDCLAPVPNRRAFMRRLDWALSMLKRYGHPCAIIYFDLNGFKRINDEYSHAAGDEVIKAVSGVLSQSMRVSDFMARMGGDEFVVMLYHARIDAARRRAAVITRRIAEHAYTWKGKPLSVSASYGVYEVSDSDTAESALASADEAMFVHKKALQS